MKSLSLSILFICSVVFFMSCAKKESEKESATATVHCSISYSCGYSGTTNALWGITYGNSTFVTIGSSGTILTSSDGVTWTSRTSGTSNILIGVTYGNGLFVTVGGRTILLTSSNVSSWTKRTSGTSENLFGVTYSQ